MEIYQERCAIEGVDPNQEILRQLKSSPHTISALFLGSKFGDTQTKCLTHPLRSSEVQSLHLDGDGLTALSGPSLASLAISARNLTVLELSRNYLGDTGASHLADALLSSVSLTTLNLSNNSIGNEGAAHIGFALARNRTLVNLSFSSSSLSRGQAPSKGVLVAVESLRQMLPLQRSTVRMLYDDNGNDEQSNVIGEAGARGLATGLRVNTTLQMLDVSCNPIGDNGCAFLFDSLTTNRTLTSLRVSMSYRGSPQLLLAGRNALDSALKSNNTVSVDLGWVSFSGFGDHSNPSTPISSSRSRSPLRSSFSQLLSTPLERSAPSPLTTSYLSRSFAASQLPPLSPSSPSTQRLAQTTTRATTSSLDTLPPRTMSPHRVALDDIRASLERQRLLHLELRSQVDQGRTGIHVPSPEQLKLSPHAQIKLRSDIFEDVPTAPTVSSPQYLDGDARLIELRRQKELIELQYQQRRQQLLASRASPGNSPLVQQQPSHLQSSQHSHSVLSPPALNRSLFPSPARPTADTLDDSRRAFEARFPQYARSLTSPMDNTTTSVRTPSVERVVLSSARPSPISLQFVSGSPQPAQTPASPGVNRAPLPPRKSSYSSYGDSVSISPQRRSQSVEIARQWSDSRRDVRSTSVSQTEATAAVVERTSSPVEREPIGLLHKQEVRTYDGNNVDTSRVSETRAMWQTLESETIVNSSSAPERQKSVSPKKEERVEKKPVVEPKPKVSAPEVKPVKPETPKNDVSPKKEAEKKSGEVKKPATETKQEVKPVAVATTTKSDTPVTASPLPVTVDRARPPKRTGTMADRWLQAVAESNGSSTSKTTSSPKAEDKAEATPLVKEQPVSKPVSIPSSQATSTTSSSPSVTTTSTSPAVSTSVATTTATVASSAVSSPATEAAVVVPLTTVSDSLVTSSPATTVTPSPTVESPAPVVVTAPVSAPVVEVTASISTRAERFGTNIFNSMAKKNTPVVDDDDSWSSPENSPRSKPAAVTAETKPMDEPVKPQPGKIKVPGPWGAKEESAAGKTEVKTEPKPSTAVSSSNVEPVVTQPEPVVVKPEPVAEKIDTPAENTEAVAEKTESQIETVQLLKPVSESADVPASVMETTVTSESLPTSTQVSAVTPTSVSSPVPSLPAVEPVLSSTTVESTPLPIVRAEPEVSRAAVTPTASVSFEKPVSEKPKEVGKLKIGGPWNQPDTKMTESPKSDSPKPVESTTPKTTPGKLRTPNLWGATQGSDATPVKESKPEDAKPAPGKLSSVKNLWEKPKTETAAPVTSKPNVPATTTAEAVTPTAEAVTPTEEAVPEPKPAVTTGRRTPPAAPDSPLTEKPSDIETVSTAVHKTLQDTTSGPIKEERNAQQQTVSPPALTPQPPFESVDAESSVRPNEEDDENWDGSYYIEPSPTDGQKYYIQTSSEWQGNYYIILPGGAAHAGEQGSVLDLGIPLVSSTSTQKPTVSSLEKPLTPTITTTPVSTPKPSTPTRTTLSPVSDMKPTSASKPVSPVQSTKPVSPVNPVSPAVVVATPSAALKPTSTSSVSSVSTPTTTASTKPISKSPTPPGSLTVSTTGSTSTIDQATSPTPLRRSVASPFLTNTTSPAVTPAKEPVKVVGTGAKSKTQMWLDGLKEKAEKEAKAAERQTERKAPGKLGTLKQHSTMPNLPTKSTLTPEQKANTVIKSQLIARMQNGGYVEKQSRFGTNPRFLRLSADKANLNYADVKPPAVPAPSALKQLAISQIKAIEDGGSHRKASQITIQLHDGSCWDIFVGDRNNFVMWCDGLRGLLGQPLQTPESKQEIALLSNIEQRSVESSAAPSPPRASTTAGKAIMSNAVGDDPVSLISGTDTPPISSQRSTPSTSAASTPIVSSVRTSSSTPPPIPDDDPPPPVPEPPPDLGDEAEW